MDIKGWIKTSLIDYPDHISTVFFTAGCNFRCPMCHNGALVLHPETLPTLPEAEIWAFLEQRRDLITGVVMTGGEPTLHAALASFLQRVKGMDYDVKLDTNGYRPDVLKRLLDLAVLDYVAMDVKAPPEKYAALTGMSQVTLAKIEASVTLIQQSGLPYEFRTTVAPCYLDEADIEEIARWIAGAQRYVLQQFRGFETLDPQLAQATPYPVARLQAMAARAGPWVETLDVRGI